MLRLNNVWFRTNKNEINHGTAAVLIYIISNCIIIYYF